MIDDARIADLATHEVENQPPPPPDRDAWGDDAPLREVVGRYAPDWVSAYLGHLGAETGRRYWYEQGERANRQPPELEAFDRYGHRLDRVHYHPAYHALMGMACGAGAHAIAWSGGPGGHLAHTASVYLLTQPEQGYCCPLVMTHAAVPALRQEPGVADEWVPRILPSAYDPTDRPAPEKAAVTIGMAMTEKQGGSDLRGSSTWARPLEREGVHELTGHKWFCSAPMSDAFLTLAHTDAGLTCFLVPRWREDGARNRVFIQRLKDKCGNRANASAEIEYERARARRVGEPGRGVATIIEMVQHTRLDAAAAPVGMMRQALVEALHHARHRRAFGRPLAEQPLMRRVLADLAIEVEAGVALVMRVAAAVDAAAAGDEGERLVARVGTAIAKYWTNKRAPGAIAEAMECLGGGGYIETSLLPRLYREAPVNGIWEGAGNVMCLDVLRAMDREPGAEAALWGELTAAQGLDPRLDRRLERLHDQTRGQDRQAAARALVEGMALAWQAGLLLRRGDAAVAAGFCAARLDAPGLTYGAACGAGPDADAILARAMRG